MSDKRNQPCPCGSGKRYKRCCGLLGKLPVSSEFLASRGNQTRALSAEDFFQRGLIASGQKRFAEAEADFRSALAIKPDLIEAHHNLGVIFEAQGFVDLARSSYLLVLEKDPTYINSLINLGCIDMDQGRMEAAAVTFHRAFTLQPDNALVNYSMAFLLMEQGKMEDSISWLRKAIALKPDYAEAYKMLSAITKYTKVDDDIQAMADLYNKMGLPDRDRINLGFALGKAFGDLRDYDKSFHYIIEANRLKRKLYEYSIREDKDYFNRIKKTFSHDFFLSHRGLGNGDETPIFIVGMPRSGTTLVEQILASHPLVFGAGEQPFLKKMTTNFSAIGRSLEQFPECMVNLSDDDLVGLGGDYIGKIREFSQNAQYITDKLPHNFIRVGFIRAILPNAKVIHCRRDSMANCFSILKTDFTGTHRYAYDMKEIGQYYKLYLNLMDHWEEVLPGFMYTIRYEELVADQLHQTKTLLDFCNLSWDAACMNFHESERKVSTASLAQVRQPIYKDSVELWKRYEKQLEPMRKAIYGGN